MRTDQGLSLCTGCAHPGILEIAREVIEQYPEYQPRTVFGGFHLHQKPARVAEEIIPVIVPEMPRKEREPKNCISA